MSKEEVQEEKATEVQDELQDKLDAVFDPDAKGEEAKGKDDKEEEVAETEEASEESTDIESESTYDQKQLDAVSRLGLDAEDLDKLGTRAKNLPDVSRSLIRTPARLCRKWIGFASN